MAGAARFIPNQRDAGRSDVHIAVIQAREIERSEIIGYPKSPRARKLDVALAQVRPTIRKVECAIAGHQVDVAVRVRGRRRSARPERATIAVGRVVIDRHLCQRFPVVSDQPAMIRADVAV